MFLCSQKMTGKTTILQQTSSTVLQSIGFHGLRVIAFQVFIQLICSLLRLPPSATALELTTAPAPALELATAPATGLELATASTSLETTTVVKPVAGITGMAICKVMGQYNIKQLFCTL
jgi:hypothetical protein